MRRKKPWQTLTARTSVQRLGRSLARPGLHPSFHRISEKANAIGRPPGGSYVFAIAFAEMMSGRAEAPGCDFAPWCAPLPAASAGRCQGSLPAGCRPAAHTLAARRLIRVCHRVCRNDERTGGSPRLRFRTLVRAPARGVSSALPGLFTRGLPPCGSCDFGTAFAEMMSGRAEAHGCDFAPWCAPLAAASAVRCQGSLPAGCRPAAHTLAALRLIRLPPGGSVYLPQRDRQSRNNVSGYSLFFFSSPAPGPPSCSLTPPLPSGVLNCSLTPSNMRVWASRN
ncbi:MAG: hypothetical protein RLZZ436_588 [Planctomycetota bacterium]